MTKKKLCLSKNNKMIGGVCAGIARYFDIDPTLVRIATLVLLFAVGSGLLLYLIAWFIIPYCEEEGS